MLELWFDFSCPFAYLASRRAPSLAAELGTQIAWRPMLLGGVFRGIGAGDGPMATLSAEKARHNLRDMHRWAELFGEPFEVPPAHPMRTVRALRVLLALPEPDWPRAIEAIYAAYWQRGDDVTSDAVLARVLAGAGFSTDVLADAFARADTDAIKAALRRRTDEAIALGIFGAPAWVLRRATTTLLWGQDRIDWVRAAWRGWDLDRAAPPPELRGVDPPPAPADRELHLYFDVASPFTYLALTQVARLGGRLALHPIALGALFRDLGTSNVPLFELSPAKRRYVQADMERWARWWGVPFAMPMKFPQRTLAAQRLCVIARDERSPRQLELAIALGRAMWAEGRDLEDDGVLAAILASLALPADWLARTREPAVKAALADETAAARAAGVFGVPTFVAGAAGDSVAIWGQDRLDLVSRALAGWRPAHG